MTATHIVRAALFVLVAVAPVAAQRPWVEARGPNVTVISDAGPNRARDVAWQFEQVREAMARIFPWVRSQSSKPLMVLAARNEASMRALAPEYWEKRSDTTLAGVTSTGFDRAYTLLRADLTTDDREGINPYEHAYWGFETRDLPAAESAVVRAAFHVAMRRPAEARALAAEAQKLEPAGVADEVAALLADGDRRNDDLRASLEKAVGQRYVSWYAPYRLATLLPTNQDAATLQRIESLLQRATALNPNADGAWAYLGEVMAALDRGDASRAPVARAIGLMPASSAHRVSMARVLRTLDRPTEALKAAGIARALAKTPEDRARATGVLSELAKELATVEPLTNETAAATGDARRANPPGQPDASGSTPSPVASPTVTPSFPRPAGAQGVPPVIVTGGVALESMEKACNEGAQAACVALGTALADSGQPGSMTRARQILKRSCDAGAKEACAVIKQLPPG